MPLAQLGDGETAVVFGVTEEAPEILRYLGDIGLRPGATVAVVEKAPLGGPVTISTDGKRCAISIELAGTVIVLPAKPQEAEPVQTVAAALE
ncbi:MAG: FeoA family protein [Candidatus Baltobacteraceae bacterium]